MAVSTWPDISHLSVSRPELINVLRQMGQQVKWPQKMKAPDSFRNPGFWCDFHRDHGHKTEDCVALKIKVNELLKKGHLREFLSEKAKSHLSKETMGNPTEAAPVSPPRQDRETNPEFYSEFQSLKEKLNEHSKQLEQSAEKLSQLESENLNHRDENQALNTASNKKRRFRAQVHPMPTLETPNSGTDSNLPPMASRGDASTREKSKDAQSYDVEDSESDPEPDKEAPDGAMKAEFPMVAYLEQMDSGNRNRGRYKNRPIEKAEGMAVSTWPDISHISVSRPELINVLRQMGQQVKWPQKMKAPDSFRNLGFWCDFHRDHGHKTEDCVTLKIEVNELLKKGHLREFLFVKAKSHLSKETTGNPTEAAPVSPPR
ncbi:hypothetical protein F2Q69_00022979 [Brassica cretica]|uniref:Uncharacterized protein n=1 Tax=Brassica cretica TaxID=69181 RepID=A0A8S9Q664_BRACR|nr:hypothetical protein F2Q69_00022979 [Brassica cretica]